LVEARRGGSAGRAGRRHQGKGMDKEERRKKEKERRRKEKKKEKR
jgi:hypothetical protein